MIHDILNEEVMNKELDNNFQINYIQNMDESFIVPPLEDRRDILKKAHGFGHYGAEAIVQYVRKDESMNWPHKRCFRNS
jgi:hypothetical protein